MNRVYISIGSNLHQPLEQAKNAIKKIHRLPNTKCVDISSFYRSKPMGKKNQPEYLNLVIALETTLLPHNLLKYTQIIEHIHGRKRTSNRWIPRTLDLDIILYGKKTIQTSYLTIPHYGLKEREFILYPLAEIAPKLRFPDGELLSDRLRLIPENDLKIW
ncbi:2-amino-4-hydroxy-6-hydroxymethyldihydropteridine diphosphokinase [Arsenophonus symbiont of Ornithomya chloropus]|uniref:2-amino-4-hydroxy-6- hydroxymethyldihydropteridine diphosphokinase n=1 Tax=Arsenophonus symbiont of Ornithomya chloropus TaxID=634121 RepID=UPI0032B259AF